MRADPANIVFWVCISIYNINLCYPCEKCAVGHLPFGKFYFKL